MMRYFPAWLLATSALFMTSAHAQIVSTYAGNVNKHRLDGQDTNSTFQSPHDLAKDRHGNIYVADMLNNAIRKITPGGKVTTFATSQTVPDFNQPAFVTVDSSDNVYYANQSGTFVGQITQSGTATIYAGSRASGQLDTISSLATFTYIMGLAADSTGVVFVSDRYKIRRIANGRVTTLAGQSASGSADGPVATAGFSGPGALGLDSAGNLFVADNGNFKIRKITPAGIVSTVAGSGSYNSIDGTGTVASFKRISDLAIDPATGNIYITEQLNDKVRRIMPGGIVTTIAGGGACGFANGFGTAAVFCSLEGIVADTAGNLLVSDAASHSIRKVAPNTYVSPFAGNPLKHCINGSDKYNSSFSLPTGVALDSNGNLYISEQGNRKIRKVTRTGIGATFCGSGLPGNQNGPADSSSFNAPADLVVNRKTGMLYVIDVNDNRIRSIDPAGNSAYFVGTGASGDVDNMTGTAASIRPTGFMCIDTAGNLYFTDIFHNIKKVTPAGLVTDYVRRPADNLAGIAADRSGNIYVAYRLPAPGIKKIAPDKTITTIYEGLSGTIPRGLACDSRGRIYLADDYGNHIFIFNQKGREGGLGTTGGYADGPWNAAKLLQPTGLAIEESDSIYIYIADRSNDVIRRTSIPRPGLSAAAINRLTAHAEVLPNPNNGVFELVARAGRTITEAEILISTSAGQTVYRKTMRTADGRFPLDLRGLNLAPGLYFTAIVSSDQTHVAKLIITR